MSEVKNKQVYSRELFLGLLIIFFSLALSILIPLAAPVFGVVLLVSGIYAYRHSTDVAIRTIAIAAISGGIIVILIAILIWLGMVAYTSTSSSIQN
jgi:uncharacterized membrane-anchored protein